MKKEIYFGIIFLAAITLILATGCLQKAETVPQDFEIYYSFGSILDTKNNLYTKDMVLEEPKIYSMQLTESEKKEIYDAIMQNDLLSIKNDFTQNCDATGICTGVSPLSEATLRITIDDQTKTILWSAAYFNQNDPELKKFLNAKEVIESIISKKEKEMNIEQPKSGYI